MLVQYVSSTRCNNLTLDQHVSPTLCSNVGYTLGQHGGSVINGFFLEILATISIIIELIFYCLLHWSFNSNLNLIRVNVFDLSFALTE